MSRTRACNYNSGLLEQARRLLAHSTSNVRVQAVDEKARHDGTTGWRRKDVWQTQAFEHEKPTRRALGGRLGAGGCGEGRLVRGRRARSGGRAAAVAAAVCPSNNHRLRAAEQAAVFRRQKRYVCSRGTPSSAFVILVRRELGAFAAVATADETETQPLFPGFQIAFPHSLTLSHKCHSIIIIMTR